MSKVPRKSLKQVNKFCKNSVKLSSKRILHLPKNSAKNLQKFREIVEGHESQLNISMTSDDAENPKRIVMSSVTSVVEFCGRE